MIKDFTFLLLACTTLVLAERWNSHNDPAFWSTKFEKTLEKLPVNGSSQNEPWSGTYWPSYKGGIAIRWQDEENDQPGFDYKLYSLEQLKSGAVDINILSPAEKFDIYNSRYDYPLVKSEWHRCSPNDSSWEGICHGWAPAALSFVQPNATTLFNDEGLAIPFAASDVKALLSYFLAQFATNNKELFIGQRCNLDLDEDPSLSENDECRDINAGTFHILMTNFLGLLRKGLVVDIQRGSEVWNQPITSYEYELGNITEPSNASAPGTVAQRSVSFTMNYATETSQTVEAHDTETSSKTYYYSLDLNTKGEIIGGSFDDEQWERVDFMWFERPPAFFGYFTKLEKIYESAIDSEGASKELTGRSPLSFSNLNPTPATTGRITLPSYNATSNHSWLIPANANSDQPLRLRFRSFNTRRHSDFVRIFEVENGEIGAPLAMLHGSEQPDDIEVRPGASVLITFHVHELASRLLEPLAEEGVGFDLFYDNGSQRSSNYKNE